MEEAPPIVASPDSKRYAQIISKGNETVLIVDGISHTNFDAIGMGSIQFSSDSKTLAYAVIRKNKAHVVVDGELGQAFDEVAPRSIIFSPASNRLAYVARIRTKWCVVLDGKALSLHDEIGCHTWSWEFAARMPMGYKPIKQGVSVNWALAFSPNGEHFAYVAKDDGQWQVVLDNVVQQPYANIKPDTLALSPNNEHLAHKAEQGDRAFVVVDGREQRNYDELAHGLPIFSPNSKRLGYFAKQRNSWVAVVDENEGQLFDSVREFSLKFSPDSSRVAYEGRVSRNGMWVVDGRAQQAYDGLGLSAFSPDSKHFVYVATRNNHRFLVFDGVEDARYSNVGVFQLSPDSKRLACDVTVRSWGRKRQIMIVDGARGDAYDDIFMGMALFSPNSMRYAHRARLRGSWHVVSDGKRGKGYDLVAGLVYSPDSKQLAYVAKKGKHDFLVVDGREISRHDEVLLKGGGRISFDSPSHLYYLARDDEAFSLHEVNLHM